MIVHNHKVPDNNHKVLMIAPEESVELTLLLMWFFSDPDLQNTYFYLSNLVAYIILRCSTNDAGLALNALPLIGFYSLSHVYSKL